MSALVLSRHTLLLRGALDKDAASLCHPVRHWNNLTWVSKEKEGHPRVDKHGVLQLFTDSSLSFFLPRLTAKQTSCSHYLNPFSLIHFTLTSAIFVGASSNVFLH